MRNQPCQGEAVLALLPCLGGANQHDAYDEFLNNILDLERWGIVQNWKGYLSTYFQRPTYYQSIEPTGDNYQLISSHGCS